MNWTEDFRNVCKTEEKTYGRNQKKRGKKDSCSEILLKLKLAVMSAQRCKIHYIQLGKIFDIYTM